LRTSLKQVREHNKPRKHVKKYF